MENNFESEERYLKVKKRVGKIKAFYFHLMIYLSILSIVIFINLKYTPEERWYWYVFAGGGIPLFIHGLKVFRYSHNWEVQKVKQILSKQDNKQVWKCLSEYSSEKVIKF